MSWSDEQSKIVKNAGALKKYEFSPLDPEKQTDAALAAEADPDTAFVGMGGGGTTSSEFCPIKEGRDDPACNGFETLISPANADVSAPEEDPEPAPGPRQLCGEALEIVEKTKKEMARLEEETCQSCSLLEQEAYDKGFKKGETDGVAAGEKKAQPLSDKLKNLINALGTLQSDLLQRHEQEIIKLIFAVCEKIIQCEISLDGRVVRETVMQVMQTASSKTELTLRLHPEDIAAIESLQTEIGNASGDIGAVTLCADTSVRPGGCLLETAHGEIDATLETRLKQVYKALEKKFDLPETPEASETPEAPDTSDNGQHQRRETL